MNTLLFLNVLVAAAISLPTADSTTNFCELLDVPPTNTASYTVIEGYFKNCEARSLISACETKLSTHLVISTVLALSAPMIILMKAPLGNAFSLLSLAGVVMAAYESPRYNDPPLIPTIAERKSCGKFRWKYCNDDENSKKNTQFSSKSSEKTKSRSTPTSTYSTTLHTQSGPTTRAVSKVTESSTKVNVPSLPEKPIIPTGSGGSLGKVSSGFTETTSSTIENQSDTNSNSATHPPQSLHNTTGNMQIQSSNNTTENPTVVNTALMEDIIAPVSFNSSTTRNFATTSDLPRMLLAVLSLMAVKLPLLVWSISQNVDNIIHIFYVD